MSETQSQPFGWPGIAPRWTSAAKSGVGTSLNPESHVWFTLSHGIFNEIYYPRVDQACIRDMGLIVTDGKNFFSEEKRHTHHQISSLEEGIPAFHLVNTCEENRYQIEKEILADPQRDVVLQQTQFTPLQGGLDDYHLYVLLAPHLGNQGVGNSAWVGDYKGVSMLFAARDNNALALASSAPWAKCSVGFVGFSDGWQDLMQHKLLTWEYSRADNGNVALIGEIDIRTSEGHFLLALGFGRNPAEAGQRALSSLLDDYKTIRSTYIREWQTWLRKLSKLTVGSFGSGQPDLFRISSTVMRVHEAKSFPGGIIAGIAIPWGFNKGDDDLGGYHLVWPRDLVETAGGLLAVGAHEDARRILHYLRVTQEADGHWPQNMWLDGTPYWSGIQMDETAFPILLTDLAYREGVLNPQSLNQFWPMVRRAAGFITCNGPVTQQDRWEEDPGYSPFTLAVEIAALLAAADLADLNKDPLAATYMRETADTWNENIERWTYVTGNDLAWKMGVEGYYVRVSPPEVADAASPVGGFVPIKNRPPGQSNEPAVYIVSPDVLALVRFGLRAADDPRVVNTVKVIDTMLKVDTPSGPAWHRYNNDGYGEHEDGSPFDGTGIGRVWPLLTGERAHYELAAGHWDESVNLLHTMEAFADEGGMMPEQIWDSPDIPEKELFFCKPSGSAMPLVWAHAEYVKLRRSLHDGHVFDMPPQPAQRYVAGNTRSPFAIWRFNHKCQTIPTGKKLRLEVLKPGIVHWRADQWKNSQDVPTRDTTLGIHVVDLPTDKFPSGTAILFTFYWPVKNSWEGLEFCVKINE